MTLLTFTIYHVLQNLENEPYSSTFIAEWLSKCWALFTKPCSIKAKQCLVVLSTVVIKLLALFCEAISKSNFGEVIYYGWWMIPLILNSITHYNMAVIFAKFSLLWKIFPDWMSVLWQVHMSDHYITAPHESCIKSQTSRRNHKMGCLYSLSIHGGLKTPVSSSYKCVRWKRQSLRHDIKEINKKTSLYILLAFPNKHDTISS